MKNKLMIIISKLLELLSCLVPKSKKIWIFGAWQGKLYADNTKYMFEYVNANHKSIKAIWITKNDDVVRQVRSMGFKCYKPSSFKGMWYVMRAKVAFETEGNRDIAYFLNSKRTKVIQLWHGMGAKAMKWKDKDGNVNIEKKKIIEIMSSYHWISTSELYTNVFNDLLCIPKDRFVITGYPRNDNLVKAPKNEYMESLKEKYNDCKLLMYMPTHRNFGADGNKLINIDELRRVDKMLKDKNLVMVYKPHIHELKNFLSYESEFTNIVMAKDQNVWGDVYSYLHYFDLVISDYSSITTDFMCTGKPVVIFAYDLDDYINGDAGLNDYFWELPGGPICYTWDDVIKKSESLLTNDEWKEERERCRVQYHYYNDGKNCERVYNMVMDILKNKKQ